jgi:hypothetical protein
MGLPAAQGTQVPLEGHEHAAAGLHGGLLPDQVPPRQLRLPARPSQRTETRQARAWPGLPGSKNRRLATRTHLLVRSYLENDLMIDAISVFVA